MTPERWKAIERLYHAALERAPDERASFLADACGHDLALQQHVAALLEEPLLEDGFVDGPALPLDASVYVQQEFAPLTGQLLGEYELRELLGRGSMGEVYRAHDTKLGRDVAIKVLPAAFTCDPERLVRFEREARMLAALNHPNICAIYGIEAEGPLRFLVLEIVEGRTLAEVLENCTRSGMAPREALTFARQICEALEAAHEKGIVHRDLKPANVKITPDGAVKVLDFGLAKPVVTADAGYREDGPLVTKIRRGEAPLIGTAAYMSPEQARGVAIDKRSDIWAFGCVLYEMLSGRLAFPGETVSDTIARVLEREPDWSAIPDSTPPAVLRLVMRCLTKEPKSRLRDIGDARLEIDAAESLPSVPRGRRLSKWYWSVPAGAAAVLLSVFGVLEGWRRQRPPPPSIGDRFARATYAYVTEWEGAELDAAISRDGKFAAFVADDSGRFHVWRTQLGTDTFDNLTPDSDDERNRLSPPVGFSADGSRIWLSGSPSGRRLRMMPLMGGAPRLFLEDRAINVSWSADDQRLVYIRAGDDGDPLFVADRQGGNASQILAGKSGDHNHFPTWSPDAQWIYFVHFVDEAMSADLWRVRSSGGAPERLTEQYKDVRYPAPIDNRTVLYVARDEHGAGPWIWALDVETRVRTRVSVGPNRYLSIASSADSRRMVATVAKSTASLWTLPIRDGIAGERDITRYTLLPSRAFAPRFAQESLFFLSSSGSGDGLWRAHGKGATEVWKASDGVLSDPVAVSPSGRIAVTLRSLGKARLVVVSPDGAVRRSIGETVDVRGAASWSPDSKSIVTGGRDAEGPGLFRIPVDGGPVVPLARGQALDPVWSPDGTLIVYAGPLAKGTSPLLATRPDGRHVPLPAIRVSAQGGGCLRFLPDGSGVVYSLGPVGNQALWLLDVRTNSVRQLAALPPDTTTSSFDITPDGRQIVFDRLRERSDIVVINLPE